MDESRLRAALAKLIKEAEARGIPVHFREGGLAYHELHWRSSKSVHAWLDADTQEKASERLPGAIRVFSDYMSQSESIDLSTAVRHASIKEPRLIEEVRTFLQVLREQASQETEAPSLGVRVEIATKWRELLLQLEKAPKVKYGLAKKWPVVTGVLSAVAPRWFPVIRWSVVEKPVEIRALFDGIYSSGAEPKVLRDYLLRFDELALLFDQRRTELGENPLGVFGVSAWLTAYKDTVLGKKASSVSEDKTGKSMNNPEELGPEVTELMTLLELHPVILQGPPGTGKTFLAERVAQAIANKDGKKGSVQTLERFEADQDGADGVEAQVVKHFVQFHASYDYEDFVRGFRPVRSDGGFGFELRDGPFTRMVTQAIRHPDVKFLLIVDEINRADLARVLGECIYLLDRRTPHEADKGRSVKTVLEGTDEGAVTLRYIPAPENPAETPEDSGMFARICVPDNFLLLGTMNTADRSIALVDVALRRRFAFITMEPSPEVVERYLSSHYDKAQGRELGERVVEWMKLLNGADASEKKAGLIQDPRFSIGHAYFLKPSLDELKASVRYQLLPLLEEYRDDGRFGDDRDDRDAIEKLFKEMRSFSE